MDKAASTGEGLTGIDLDDLEIYYFREGATGTVSVTGDLQASTKGVWKKGGWAEVDSTNMPGIYEFGIPDEALASGAESVAVLMHSGTNPSADVMAPVPIEIVLTDRKPHADLPYDHRHGAHVP